MKTYLYSASILKDTRKLVSNTNSDWSKVMPGSYIKFVSDDNFYTVINNERIFIIKEFEVLDPRRIKIKGNAGIKINKGDLIKVSYKEYELSTIANISNGGTGYKVDDIIELEGGTPSIDSQTNKSFNTKLKVQDIGNNGEITQIGLIDRGRYNVFPEEKNNLCRFSGGSGRDAILELYPSQLESATIIERTIHIINNLDTSSMIVLDYNLPLGIKRGNFTIEKWEATIKEDYFGDTQINAPYEVYNDFTPNYRFPLPVKGSLSTEIILRQCLLNMDIEMSKLSSKISDLERKLNIT